tara:strand:+ start:125 stop:358 length:234 start_codon:yes stop_codon:yes gene_type:complete
MSEDKVFVKYRNTKRPEENEDMVETLSSWIGVLLFENEMRDEENQIDLNKAIEQIKNDKFVLRIGFATTTVTLLDEA